MSFYLYLFIAYLMGGVPFALIVGYLAGQGDIRRKGSGNVGATNVWRLAGPIPAMFVFVGDIGKGAAAVLITSSFYQAGWPVSLSNAALIAGILAVLGHTYSPYLGFRGGKGVNTAVGVFISLMPIETLIAVGVSMIVVFAFRYISLGSMVGAVTLAVIIWVEKLVLGWPIESSFLVVSAIIAAFILYTHRQNIKRLASGTENRFQLRKASQ
ncbi:MAG: glycerol-3-phosphate 1-O-acyltransferase PlsY [FCB group bacterium]|nr:glycerol-3-phosphate 1-O-acyltransferase PlsY [FCB group bacterium]